MKPRNIVVFMSNFIISVDYLVLDLCIYLFRFVKFPYINFLFLHHCLVLTAYHDSIMSIKYLTQSYCLQCFYHRVIKRMSHKITLNNRQLIKYLCLVLSALSDFIFISFWISYVSSFFAMEHKSALKSLNIGVNLKTIEEVENNVKRKKDIAGNFNSFFNVLL